MKNYLPLLVILISTNCFTGCASTDAGQTPSLAGNSRPTNRLPSPSNFQRNSLIDSNTMIAPTRPQ